LPNVDNRFQITENTRKKWLHPKTTDFFSPKTAHFFQILERPRKKERKQRKNKQTKKLL